MKIFKTTLILLLLYLSGYSQSINNSLNELTASFKAFEYSKVISLSNKIIAGKDSLSFEQKTDVLRMQAVAYYSIDELINAERSFVDLLNIESNFVLDPSANSPKIVTFFNSIKIKYLSSQISASTKEEPDTLNVANLKQDFQDYKAGMLRSIVLPGWGHYYVDEPLKGKILNLASLLTLAPGIYYSFETASREKKYLNESDRTKIETRYNSFNDAYNYRNYLMSAFTVIWMYTQYDYFFSERPSSPQFIKIAPGYDPFNKTKIIRFSIQF